jgi:hypothetical protein
MCISNCPTKVTFKDHKVLASFYFLDDKIGNNVIRGTLSWFVAIARYLGTIRTKLAWPRRVTDP